MSQMNQVSLLFNGWKSAFVGSCLLMKLVDNDPKHSVSN